MNKYFIDPANNKEYFSGLRTMLSSIGFGLLGAYAYGWLTSPERIDKPILIFMVISLIFVFILYLISLKGNVWFGKPPANRQMVGWRVWFNRATIFCSQILVGVFCSIFNDFLLKGESFSMLLILYIALLIILMLYPRVMVISVTPFAGKRK